MDKRLRMFPIVFFILTAALILSAMPARAESVEEKIKALENELTSLKAQQVELKNEATAAAAALPEFSYRPGRGMRIRGADRSWQFTLGYEGHGQMGFFPGSAKSIDNDSANDGPSQGAMVVRHNELSFEFELLDGLYEMGTTIRFDSSPPRSKSESLQINLGNFSPYYPTIQWLHTSLRSIFDPVYNSSSTSGTTLDRAFVNDSLYSTMSTKGVGLLWEDVPLGTGDFTTGVVYGTGHDNDSKTASNSNTQRAFNTGINLRPFRAMKGSPLAGLGLGVGFIRDHNDRRHARNFYNVSMGTSANEVDVFNLSTRGARYNTSIWAQYNQGPIRLGSSYNWHKAERDFTGDFGGDKEGDAKMNVFLLRTGLFVWGPNGFLSGDENGGLLVAFNHFRNYFDAGSGFDVRNEFDEMRRYNIIQNIGLLRYFYRPNIIYAVEYQNSLVSKMRGGGDAEDARRRLGIRSSGGTAQTVTLAFKLNF